LCTDTHTHTHTHTQKDSSEQVISLSQMQVLYISHNTHKGQTSMPSVEFEPTIPAIKHLQTYA